MEKLDELEIKKMEEYIELFIKNNTQIFPEDFEERSQKYKEDFERTILVIKNVILDLINRQKIDYHDIEYIGAGAYSSVIKVGEFAVKLGAPRENRGVPYSKYIIDALISINLMMGISMEVQNLVDAEWWKIKDENGNVIRELTDEEINDELFRLHVKLLTADGKKDGIKEKDISWKDPKKENVGRLLKPNVCKLKQEYLLRDGKIVEEDMQIADIDKEIVGRKEGENEILPAGELVIIDRDYLVGRGAWTPKNPEREKVEEFNKRYEAMDR